MAFSVIGVRIGLILNVATFMKQMYDFLAAIRDAQQYCFAPPVLYVSFHLPTGVV